MYVAETRGTSRELTRYQENIKNQYLPPFSQPIRSVAFLPPTLVVSVNRKGEESRNISFLTNHIPGFPPLPTE